jgi:hypothetical protein
MPRHAAYPAVPLRSGGLTNRFVFPKAASLIGDILLSFALIAQHISDGQVQAASEIVCGFAAGILDPVVTFVISKWPVLEFAIAILNNFRTNLSAEKIIQRLGLGRGAGQDDGSSIVFHGTRIDRFFNAVAHTRQCQLFRAYLSVTRGGDQHEADYNHQSTHFRSPTSNGCLRKHLATQPKTD